MKGGRVSLVQVTSTTLEGNTLKIKVDEVVVNDINLRFENQKSGEVKAEGKTKPDVILRHILSQPGKANPNSTARAFPRHQANKS